MSALPSKVDITEDRLQVRFMPIASRLLIPGKVTAETFRVPPKFVVTHQHSLLYSHPTTKSPGNPRRRIPAFCLVAQIGSTSRCAPYRRSIAARRNGSTATPDRALLWQLRVPDESW